MEQSELLRHVVKAIEAVGAPYLVTGSVATIFYGEPRLTNDTDVVDDLKAEQIAGFARAVRVRPGADYEASFASAEDVIIKKMEYYSEGGSEKHLRDITGVLKISGDQIDASYIADWASRLGLESVWRAVQERAAQ